MTSRNMREKEAKVINKKCKRQCSATDKFAAVLCLVIIVTVSVALLIIMIAELLSPETIHCEWIMYDNETMDICGNQTFNKILQSDDCINECNTLYDDDLSMIYYINSTSNINLTCYCLTISQLNAINTDNESENKYEDYCFEIANDSHSEINRYIKQCSVAGRPYNIHDNKHLVSDIKYIDCIDYEYYDNPDWKLFIENSTNTEFKNDTNNMELVNKWLNQGLSEHAAIATFARFSLQLMSIGAPLWMIELSNNASLDEIKHSKIAFDVANMYLNGMNNDNKCIVPNLFPQHNMNINGDWNEISKDTAMGGCFGETLAALTLQEYKYDNIIDDYIYDITMEEIRHSALGWIVVKWMIDHVDKSNNIKLIDVANQHWWNLQLLNRKRTISNVRSMYIYGYVIPLILDKMWITNDYIEFYQFIIEKLQVIAQSPQCDNVCEFFLNEI